MLDCKSQGLGKRTGRDVEGKLKTQPPPPQERRSPGAEAEIAGRPDPEISRSLVLNNPGQVLRLKIKRKVVQVPLTPEDPRKSSGDEQDPPARPPGELKEDHGAVKRNPEECLRDPILEHAESQRKFAKTQGILPEGVQPSRQVEQIKRLYKHSQVPRQEEALDPAQEKFADNLFDHKLREEVASEGYSDMSASIG